LVVGEVAIWSLTGATWTWSGVAVLALPTTCTSAALRQPLHLRPLPAGTLFAPANSNTLGCARASRALGPSLAARLGHALIAKLLAMARVEALPEIKLYRLAIGAREGLVGVLLRLARRAAWIDTVGAVWGTRSLTAVGVGLALLGSEGLLREGLLRVPPQGTSKDRGGDEEEP